MLQDISAGSPMGAKNNWNNLSFIAWRQILCSNKYLYFTTLPTQPSTGIHLKYQFFWKAAILNKAGLVSIISWRPVSKAVPRRTWKQSWHKYPQPFSLLQRNYSQHVNLLNWPWMIMWQSATCKKFSCAKYQSPVKINPSATFMFWRSVRPRNPVYRKTSQVGWIT